MSSIRDIKQRLSSIEQTRQITNAMYLLSTSMMRKSMQNVSYNIEYMNLLRGMMKDIIENTKGAGLHDHYIDKSENGKALFVAVAGDKGLCGGFNAAVAQLTKEKMSLKEQPILYSFGLIGADYFENRSLEVTKQLNGSSMHPSIHTAREIANEVLELYNSEEVNEIYFVYNRYFGSSVHFPVCIRLLPLLRHDFTDVGENADVPTDLLFEPSPEAVLKHIVPLYCTGMIYDILMQSSTAENSARLEAMQSATRNADEMIGKLQMDMNAARQLAITNEITEIAAAGEAQNGS